MEYGLGEAQPEWQPDFDPSMLRARMVWEYMRAQGYVAPRVSHVRPAHQRRVQRGGASTLSTSTKNFLEQRFKHDQRQLVRVMHLSRGVWPTSATALRPCRFSPPWNAEQRTSELETKPNRRRLFTPAAPTYVTRWARPAGDDCECDIEAVFDIEWFSETRCG